MELSQEDLNLFFLSYLHKCYCIQTHFVERLEELSSQPALREVRYLIRESIQLENKQVKILEKVYRLLGEDYSFRHCEGLIGYVDEAFDEITIGRPAKMIRLSFLSYVLRVNTLLSVQNFILQYSSSGLKDGKISRLLDEKLHREKNYALLFHLLQDSI